MFFEYTPYRLFEAKENINKQHPIENIPASPNHHDENLENLIVRLVTLKESQIKLNALSLTKKEIRSVISYLPYNFYSVDMTNLFKVFNYRINEDLCHIFYYHWQDSYANNACNSSLIADILEPDNAFSAMLNSKHLSVNEYKSFLLNGDIAVHYGLKVKNHNFSKGTSLKDKLEFFGVRYNSRLYKDCEFLFFTFCSEDDYLSADKTLLLNTLKAYSTIQAKEFLQNFLPLFTIIYKVIKFFGNDERSSFWSKYSFTKVYKHKYSDSIIMEFDNHIAIEFLGQGMGPA